MIKKDKKPEELGSWMDTYGDMVTLLLCFFVLLYSMSSVDQTKWKLLVQSFNPSALEGSDQVVLDANVTEGDGKLTGGVPDDGGGTTDFDELYLMLKKVVDERNMQDSVEITRKDRIISVTTECCLPSVPRKLLSIYKAKMPFHRRN
jgi:chemotaxis protein MotB